MKTVEEWWEEQGGLKGQAAKRLGIKDRDFRNYITRGYYIQFGEPVGRMVSFQIYNRVNGGFVEINEGT